MKRHILSFAVICMVALAASACSDDDKTPGKTYKVGDLYEVGGAKGIVYIVAEDGLHGMIFSLDETTLRWATEQAAGVVTGATDENDGTKNMAAIEKITGWQTDYPAFAWCAAKNTSGGGWFLPAFEQVADLYEVYSKNTSVFNKYLTDNDGTAIVAETYWSSSESLVVANEAAFLRFEEDASFGFMRKTDVARLRAVRAF